MELFKIFILAIVQGAAELLPVSSSAHVILASKFLGLDPAAAEMTFLLVMLHTGTMFAVLFYYRQRWMNWFWNRNLKSRKQNWKWLTIATVVTLGVGLLAKQFIEKFVLGGHDDAQMEDLFGRLDIIALMLFLVGLIIIAAGLYAQRTKRQEGLSNRSALMIGLIQGFCIPLRGFSRSGATISMALFHRVSAVTAEEFSFGLALILTPPAIGRMIWRLHDHGVVDVKSFDFFESTVLTHGLIGMGMAFVAGILALRWLSRWLEGGRWHYFGFYNLIAATTIWILNAYYFTPTVALGLK